MSQRWSDAERRSFEQPHTRLTRLSTTIPTTISARPRPMKSHVVARASARSSDVAVRAPRPEIPTPKRCPPAPCRRPGSSRPHRASHPREEAEHEEEAAHEVEPGRDRSIELGADEQRPRRASRGAYRDRRPDDEGDPSCPLHVRHAYSAAATRRRRSVQAHVHRPALERVVAGDQVILRDGSSGGGSTSHGPRGTGGSEGGSCRRTAG